MQNSHKLDKIHKKESKHKKHSSHKQIAEDFKKRFWVSAVLTLPILLLSPMIQQFLGLKEFFSFTGDLFVLFVLSSVIYFYGGWPFIAEIKRKNPDMMTLIAVAITTAYAYSSAVVFILPGKLFFGN